MTAARGDPTGSGAPPELGRPQGIHIPCTFAQGALEFDMTGDNEPQPAVRCRGLTKSYGSGPSRVAALRGADLELRRGELLMLVGPSGCGKTTLISILAAILAADGGTCEVLGQNLARMDETAKAGFRRRSIGFVFQAFNLLPALSVRENVSLPLLVAGVARREALARAARLVDAVGLGERADALPGQLSGGQKQRVAIARAMIHAPQLIICDEPTSNLDHKTGGEVMALLRSAAMEDGRSLIVVTHDTRIVGFGERVAYMDDGRITAIEARKEGITP